MNNTRPASAQRRIEPALSLTHAAVTRLSATIPNQRVSRPRRTAGWARAAWLALGLLLGQAAGAQAPGREGVEVGGNSAFTRLVPAEGLERSAQDQYRQMLQQAAEKGALAGRDHPQLRRGKVMLMKP